MTYEILDEKYNMDKHFNYKYQQWLFLIIYK